MSMADIKNDILKKALDGKVATDPSIKSEEEPFKSNTLPGKTVAAPIRALGWTPGDVRFVGNVTDPTLYAQSAPDDHPRRNRRLVQEQLFYGMDVYAEGTAGELTATTTLNTHGVNVDFVLGAPHSMAASDLLLVISNRDRSSTHLIPKPKEGAPRTYEITDLNGDVITINGIFEDIFDGTGGSPDNEGFYWQLVKPNPVELLPFTATGNLGEETSYFTVQPKRWPVRRTLGNAYDVNDAEDMEITSVEHTAEGRLQVTVEHSGSNQILEVGDFVASTTSTAKQPLKLQDRIFVVESEISFTSGATSTEKFILTPFYGTDISTLPEQSSPFRLRKIHAVEDLFPAGHPTTGHPLRDFRPEQPHYQDMGFRVKPLVGPKDVDSSQNSTAGSILATNIHAGHALTLFPAKVDGTPDLDNPISNFDDIQISSSTEDQWVNADYDNGVVTLSHQIEAGYDLNPNSFTDGAGRARLFAMFVAYNEKSGAQAARELVHRAEVDVTAKGGNAGRIRMGGQNYTESGAPLERSKGWLMEFPMREGGDLYHYDPVEDAGGNEEIIGFTRSEAGDGEVGPQHQYQYRALSSGMHHLGSMRFGNTDNTRRHNQFVFVPDAAVEQSSHDGTKNTMAVGETNKPSYRITYSALEFLSDNESSWVGITAGVNDHIHFVINDIDVEFDLPAGGINDTGLQTILDNEITTAATAAGVDTDDYVVEVYDPTSTGDPQIRFKAGVNLYFYAANGHANLGFPENEGVDPEGIRLQYGHNGTIESTLEWVRDTDNLVFDGNDIQLGTGESVKDHETRITTNEGDITTVTNNYNDTASSPSDFISIDALGDIAEGSTFIQAEGSNLGDLNVQVLLEDAADTLYFVEADGNGSFFLVYGDSSAAETKLAKCYIEENSGSFGDPFTEASTPIDVTSTPIAVSCNGPVIGIASEADFTLYDTLTMTMLGSDDFIAEQANLVSFEIRKGVAFCLTRDDTNDDITLTAHRTTDTGSWDPADQFTSISVSTSVGATDAAWMTCDGSRAYVIIEGADAYVVKAYDFSVSGFTLAWEGSAADKYVLGETANSSFADGTVIYTFGNHDSAQFQRLGRSGRSASETRHNPANDDTVSGTFGVADHTYLYVYASDSNVYILNKHDGDVVDVFFAGSDTITNLTTDGTWLYYGRQPGSGAHYIEVRYTGDRGGLWKKSAGQPPTYKWRQPLYSK